MTRSGFLTLPSLSRFRHSSNSSYTIEHIASQHKRTSIWLSSVQQEQASSRFQACQPSTSDLDQHRLNQLICCSKAANVLIAALSNRARSSIHTFSSLSPFDSESTNSETSVSTARHHIYTYTYLVPRATSFDL